MFAWRGIAADLVLWISCYRVDREGWRRGVDENGLSRVSDDFVILGTFLVRWKTLALSALNSVSSFSFHQSDNSLGSTVNDAQLSLNFFHPNLASTVR